MGKEGSSRCGRREPGRKEGEGNWRLLGEGQHVRLSGVTDALTGLSSVVSLPTP